MVSPGFFLRSKAPVLPGASAAVAAARYRASIRRRIPRCREQQGAQCPHGAANSVGPLFDLSTVVPGVDSLFARTCREFSSPSTSPSSRARPAGRHVASLTSGTRPLPVLLATLALLAVQRCSWARQQQPTRYPAARLGVLRISAPVAVCDAVSLLPVSGGTGWRQALANANPADQARTSNKTTPVS